MKVSIRLLSSLFLTFIFANVLAQNNEFEKIDGRIYKNNELYSGTYKVQNKGVLISIFEISKGLENGVVKHFYPDEKVKEVGSYFKGKKDGKWEKWDANGNKVGEAFYKKGKKSGVWTIWDHNKIKRNQMEYKKGKRKGTWKMWDKSGVLVQEKEY